MGYRPWGCKESDTTEALTHKGDESRKKKTKNLSKLAEQIKGPVQNISVFKVTTLFL